MIKVTPKAAEKFKADLRAESLPENTMLRIDGKHSEEEKDMQLALFFDTDEPCRDDNVRITEGVRLVVNKALAGALGNTQLDYRAETGSFVLERIPLTQ